MDPRFNPEYIRQILHELEEHVDDKTLRYFSINRSWYRLNPCSSEEQVLAYEHLHGIRLPEEYRTFLRSMGNGCAGIFPLGVYTEPAQHNSSDRYVGYLNKPFPHTSAWRPSERKWYGLKQLQGSFEIVHCGCASYCLLIVSGPERGNTWYHESDFGGVEPINTETGTGRVTFSNWFLKWLDDQVAVYIRAT